MAWMWPGPLRVSEIKGRNTYYKKGFFSEVSLLSRSSVRFYLLYVTSSTHGYKVILSPSPKALKTHWMMLLYMYIYINIYIYIYIYIHIYIYQVLILGAIKAHWVMLIYMSSPP